MHAPLKSTLLAMLSLTFPAAAAADTISLRGAVRVGSGSVTLAEVADLDGAYAERWGGVAVAAFDTEPGRVAMRTVRQRLEARGVNWGRLILRGAKRVALHRADQGIDRPGDLDRERAQTGAAPARSAAPSSPGIVQARTLRARLIAWLEKKLEISSSALKVRFENDDAPLLRTAARGVRCVFEPLGRDLIGRVPIEIRRFKDERLVATDRVRADVRVRRTVLTTVGPVERGRPLTDTDVNKKAVWLDADPGRALTDRRRAVGMIAAEALPAGTVLEADHLREPVLVERGERVTVRCVSGGLVIRTTGRAMEDGGAERIIPIRNERTRETFYARVTGRREAVLTIEDSRKRSAQEVQR